MTSLSAQKICDETEVILDAKRLQEEALRRSFRHYAEPWDETGRKSAKVKEKLLNWPGQRYQKQKLPERVGHSACFGGGRMVEE